MYPVTEQQAKNLILKTDLETVSRCILRIGGTEYDISRFVSKFGSLSRSLEYDTGRFSPSSHSLNIENTREFGDFLFSLRHKINGNNTPGTAYWPNGAYKIYHGFRDPGAAMTSGFFDDLICTYEGIINGKVEDRIKETVSINSNDIIRRLQEKQVATADLIFDDVFTNKNSESDIEQIQQVIRYGKHYFNYKKTLNKSLSCAVTNGGATPYEHWHVTTTTEHGLQKGQIVEITGTTNYNGEWVVSDIDPDDEFVFFIKNFDNGAGSENGTLDVYDFSDEIKSEGKAGGGGVYPVIGYPNKYIANEHGETAGTKYDLVHWYNKPGSLTTMYARTSPLHNKTAAESYFIKDTAFPARNIHSNLPPMAGLITAVADNGSGLARLTIDEPFPSSGGPWDIAITGTTNYNGNQVATYVDSTHVDLAIAYVSDQTGAYTSRDLITVNVANGADDTTGHIYFGCSDAEYLWYFPLQNPIMLLDFLDDRLNPTGVWFWDYIGGRWVKFLDANLTNVNYGFTLNQQTGIVGVYLKIRNEGTMTGPQWKTNANSWDEYVNGTGAYWATAEPRPSIALEIDNQLIIEKPDPVFQESFYSNPAVVLYRILTEASVGNIGSASLDFDDFTDTAFTVDAAAQLLTTAGDFETGCQVNVAFDSPVSVLDMLQKVALASGIMIVCSNILSTDRRLKFISVKPYNHSNDAPLPPLSFSTNDDLSELIIVSEQNKIKNVILLNNFVEGASLINGYIETIKETDGDANQILDIAQGADPQIILYDSHSFAVTIAENYLAKLKDAWEDVRSTTDVRGIIIECGDFVKIYDHKHDETIVVQVYNIDNDYDGDVCMISGKKVWSSKD